MEWKLFADLSEVAGERRVSVDPEPDATVGDALDALLAEHPDLADRVLADDGDLRDHINVLVNGENVHTKAGLDTSVSEGDELALFPPVTGG